MTRSFLDLARELADLRKAHATEFLLQRVMYAKTDGQAKAAADERFIHDLTMAEARYDLYRSMLGKDDPYRTITESLNAQVEESYEHPHPNPDHQPEDATPDTEGPDKECAD